MNSDAGPATVRGAAGGSAQPWVPQTELTQLMHMLGSPGGQFDSLPPSSNDFFLGEIPGESPFQQVLAWARAHKVRLGHWKDRQGRLVAHLVDENGDPVELKDLAGDLRWTLDKAREYWARGRDFGLLGGGTPGDPLLYLRGNVRRFKQVSSDSQPHDDESGKKDCTNLLHSPFVLPGYTKREIAKWEPQRRAAFEARYRALVTWGQELARDLMAEGRATIDEHKDRLFAEFGLPRQRQKKRRQRSKIFRLTVLVDEYGQGELFPEPPEAAQPPVGAGTATEQPPQQSSVQAPEPTVVHAADDEFVERGMYEGIGLSVQTQETAVQTGFPNGQVTEPEADSAATPQSPLKTLETLEEPQSGGAGSSSVVEGTRPPALAPTDERQTLIDGCAQRGVPISPDYADLLLSDKGPASLTFFFRTLNEQIEAAHQKRKTFSYKWLRQTARDAAGRWPAVEAQYRAMEAEQQRAADRGNLLELNNAYDTFCQQKISEKLEADYPPDRLETALRERLKSIKREQPEWFARVLESTRREVALGRLKAAIREQLALPTFERWRAELAP